MTRDPHRREGRRRATVLVASLGLLVALPFVLGGATTWLREDDRRGIPVLVVGLAMILASLAALRWVGRSLPAAAVADAREAHSLGLPPVPFGAEPHEDAMVLRPRAAVRVAPGFLVPLMLLVAWGMAENGLTVQSTVVAVGTAAVAVLWWCLRSYELCLDPSGIWRRRRPHWNLAWSDLHSVENKPMSNRWYPDRPDDLVLHGRVTTPRGRVRAAVRIRCNLLAIPAEDFRALADQMAGRGAATVTRHRG